MARDRYGTSCLTARCEWPCLPATGEIGPHEASVIWCAPTLPSATRLAVVCQKAGEIVGAVGVVDRQLSYFVARKFWGLGYGGAMVREFLQTHVAPWPAAPLRARVVRENLASRRILEAMGFVVVGLEVPQRGLPCRLKYVKPETCGTSPPAETPPLSAST